MRELDVALVTEVWQTLCGYEPERSTAEARAFIEHQPHLVALAEALTREFGRDTQKAALGLVFLLTKVVEAHLEAPIASVSRARVTQAYDATLQWMERWEGAEPRFLERSGEFPQPHLVLYLLSVFYPEGAGPAEYEAEVKGSLFLLLTSAADAITGPLSPPPGEEGSPEAS